MKILLWKLGHLDKQNPANSILPTKEAVAKFATMLKENTKDTDKIDIIWGPDISVELVEIDEDVISYVVDSDGKLVKV